MPIEDRILDWARKYCELHKTHYVHQIVVGTKLFKEIKDASVTTDKIMRIDDEYLYTYFGYDTQILKRMLIFHDPEYPDNMYRVMVFN